MYCCHLAVKSEASISARCKLMHDKAYANNPHVGLLTHASKTGRVYAFRQTPRCHIMPSHDLQHSLSLFEINVFSVLDLVLVSCSEATFRHHCRVFELYDR